MAIQQHRAREAYRCPECSGQIAFEDGAWGCSSCPFVPRHSAD